MRDIVELTGQEVMEIIKEHWLTWQDSSVEAYFQLEENGANRDAFHKYYEAIGIHNAIEEIIMEVEDKEIERQLDGHQYPKKNSLYYYIRSGKKIWSETWCDYPIDYDRLKKGNCYNTEQEAKDALRSQRLVAAVARRRKELNGDWKPNWEDKYERKFFIVYVDMLAEVGTNYVSVVNYTPTFGFYESDEKADKLIEEFYGDFIWYFTEYLPSIN